MLNTPKPPAICLMGPTAAGKTALAMQIAEELDCEIISVDSGQVYRGMDIGTAKPNRQTLAKFPHRLIDIRDPSQAYSAAEFRADALHEMQDIQAQGRTPLLVGGTMLYFKVLGEGIAELPEADAAIRAQIQADADRLGWPELHQRLQAIDPLAAAKIHPNNPQRIMRALEVYKLTGVALGKHWQGSRDQINNSEHFPFQLVNIALIPTDRGVLHKKIAARFDQMLQQGLIDEVKALHRRDELHPELPSIRAVGYRQVWNYLDRQYGAEEMRTRAVAATRQLAKRQLTWLRGWPELRTFEPRQANLRSEVLKILQRNSI